MKVLVLGAGGPAGVNTIRALRAAGHEVYAFDDNPAHLVWVEPYGIPLPYLGEIAADDFDLVIAQPDSMVRTLASQGHIPSFLPSLETIAMCQDKWRTSTAWKLAGLRRFDPYRIAEPWPDHLLLAEDALGLPYWLRATKGAGARGAILVRETTQAYHWIRFHQERGAEIDWIAEEYLPGRDLAWSSIWFEGALVTSFLRERLEYVYPHLDPEGLTGTPAVARIVHDIRANMAAYEAVLAIDESPHGIYSVDLREDVEALPRPTEINAGRGFTTFGLWSTYDLNFLDLYVRLGVDGANWWLHRPDLRDEWPRFDALPDGLTLSRHIDCAAVFTFAREEVAA